MQQVSLTWKTVLTTVVFGFVYGVSKYSGEIVAGQFKLWMLLPITAVGIGGGALFLFARFLWRLHTSIRNLTALSDRLGTDITLQNDQRKEAFAYLQTEMGHIKTAIEKLRTDMRRDSAEYQEKIKKITDAMVKRETKGLHAYMPEEVVESLKRPGKRMLESGDPKPDGGLGLGPKPPGLGFAK
jgi:hypothetical protein